MRSVLGHPVLDYLRLLEWRGAVSPHRDRVAAESGVPISTVDHLALIVIDRPHGLDVSGLAAAMGLSAARASRQATRLEELGLIHRARSPVDRRATILTLSDAGSSLRHRWAVAVGEDYAAAIGALPPALRSTLSTELPALSDALSRTRIFETQGRATVSAHADPMFAFARWAAPIIGHPSYTRSRMSAVGMPGTPQSLSVLRACAEESMDVATLARHTAIARSAVSRHIAQAQAHSLVTTRPGERDARSTFVAPTTLGLHYLRAIEATELSAIARATQDWASERLHRLLDALAVFTEHLRRTDLP